MWWLPIIGPTATVSTPRLRVGAPREPLTLVGHHVDAKFLSQIFTLRVYVAVRWGVMLSIAKLRVGQEAYQLSGVAQSLDDYYTGAGEADGVWVGGGAARLGLAGEVDPDDLRAVLAGLAPGWGGLTPNGEPPRPHRRRVPGFDLTFKAPKSASVLYAVSDDPRVQGAVIEAGETAMRAALGWLEREAVRVRRGSHNQAWLAAHTDEPGVGPRQLVTSGVVAASFRHRTSRAGDPLLHWHVLVANLAEGTDGRWSALYGAEIYRHARAAGEVFQAVFRDELTVSLGVEWRPGRHVPEIAGIPQALLDTFSKRSTEIEAWLAATGTPDTPQGRQAAVLATRRHKPEVELDRFDDGWKAEAVAAGWGPDAAERLAGWSQQRAGHTVEGGWRLDTVDFDEHGPAEHGERVVEPEEWIAHLLRTELTASTSTFTEADLVRAVAARQGHGATVETIERIASRVLASDQVIAVATDETEPARWTSRELVDVESGFLAALAAPPVHRPLPPRAVERAVAGGSLGADQLAAVHVIAAERHPVAVLVGPAGTGKTFTLDAVRAAFTDAGLWVFGAAPSARAAIELTAGAGIPARTLHSLLNSWSSGWDCPQRGSLLVIDEAGMADIRTLEAVVSRQVAAGGRVLLVGDHHQLPEVAAGGGFAYAATHAPCVAELTVNRRQHQPWEQAALAELRAGSVAQAVDAYLRHGRVVVADNPNQMIAVAVDRWFDARAAGRQPVLLAGTNDLVERLNQAVIARLTQLGELDGDAVGFGSGWFRVGERIVVRRNSNERTIIGQTIEVANGHTGLVVAVSARGLAVRLDRDGTELVLGDRYLARGGQLSHAYALTTHRAQGGTWDLAIAVGADGLYREGAYVELSRGSHENWLVLTDPEAADLHRQAVAELERHDTGLTPPEDEPSDLAGDLIERISRSHAKQFAHSLDPDLDMVDHLARIHTLSQLESRRDTAMAAERIATDTHGYDADALAEALARIDHVARHITVGGHVSPPIGTTSAPSPPSTTGPGRPPSGSCRSTGMRPPAASTGPSCASSTAATNGPLPAAALQRLDTITRDLTNRIEHWQASVRALGTEPGDAHRYARAVDRQLERHTHTLAAEPPSWLTDLLGVRPADVAGATAWDDTVRDLARWRSLRQLPDTVPALGERPASRRGRNGLGPVARPARAHPHLARHQRPHPSHRHHHPQLPRAPRPSRRTRRAARRLPARLALDHQPAAHRPTHPRRHHRAAPSRPRRTAARRRDWIIANWPHVVEYQEINRTLTTATWGPDPHLLTDLLTRPLTPTLAAAVERRDPWLRVALNSVADGSTESLDDEAVGHLETLALGRADTPSAASVEPGLSASDTIEL